MNNSKTILITGASRGIGKAIAKILGNNDYEILAPGSKDLDVTKQESINKYLNENLGSKPLYGLVSNAGIYYENALEKHSIQEFSKILDVNLTGAFRIIQSTLANLKIANDARIILISSVSAYGNPGAPAYAASKAGLIAMMKSLAPELSHHDISINTINPGWVRTDMAQAILKTQTSQEANLGANLQKRWIEPEEIAHLVKFLLSKESKAISGESINIDAGLMV